MKTSSLVINSQRIDLKYKINKSHNNIEIPQQLIKSNRIIHSRTSQSYCVPNRRLSISKDTNNQQKQKWRPVLTKPYRKIKTQQTSRSNHFNEAKQRYNDHSDNVQRVTTASFLNIPKSERKKRKTVCISQGHGYGQYTLFNGKQLKVQCLKMVSQPVETFTFKDKIINRINQKLTLAKKMTSLFEQQEEKSRPLLKISNIVPTNNISTSQSTTLFEFDRFYDHCIKNLKKCINIYQKDLNRPKDRTYFQLKMQSTILSKQLKSMRTSLVKKKEVSQDMAESGMGIIGKNISVQQIQKNSINRGISAHLNKKIGKIKKRIDKKNPFSQKQMEGWNIQQQKGDDFYI